MALSKTSRCLVSMALCGAIAQFFTPPLAIAQSVRLSEASSDTLDIVDETLGAFRAGELSTRDAAESLAASAGAPDALFDALSRGRLRTLEPDHSVRSTRFSGRERALLIDALRRLPWRDVCATLDARGSTSVDVPTRLAAMEVLAALGRPEDVRTLLTWAQLEGPTVRVTPEMRAALTTRLDELLARQPEALRHLHGVIESLNRSLLVPYLQGLARTPSARRLAALGELLAVAPELDAYVLVEIGYMAPRARAVPDGATRARVRRYLESRDLVLVHEAIAAAGHLADRDAIPALIDLLDADDRVAAQRAHRALVQITGQQLAKAPSDWHEWHAKTSEWWQDVAPRRLQVAVAGPPGAASLALQELAKLRLQRHELSPMLAECLRREEVELVLLTCAALGHLGSPASMRPLLDMLSHPNVDIRRAAYLALRRISGEDHGDDPAEWRARGW